MPYMLPSISILMPVRNAESFLPACVESILNQTLENWELITVDDHSEDSSLSILAAFAKRERRIRHLPNRGVGIQAALRTAFHHSNGTFITRMDADDLMEPLKLETLGTRLATHGPGNVVTGQVSYFSETTVGKGYQRYAEWLNSVIELENWERELYRECVLPSPCWMIRRQDLAYCGAFQGERYPEDYDLCFRLWAGGIRFIGCKEVLHHWRDHERRSSRTQEAYLDNSFFALKVYWFLRIHRDFDRPLLIWGAGKRGKEVVQLLLQEGARFSWITNNPAKIGKQIYGHPVRSTDHLDQIREAQVCVIVSAREDQKKIQLELEKQGFANEQIFFFR